MNDGFFGGGLVSKAPPSRKARCGECGLFKGCRSPKMPPTGEGRKKILIIAEAPGCIAGDSLIDTAFRDKSLYPNGIPIKDLVGRDGEFVYCYNLEKEGLSIGEISKAWCSGRKVVYRVTYQWKYPHHNRVVVLENHLDVSSNHQFLLKRQISHDPFKGIESESRFLSIDDGLSVGHSIQPFLRHLDDGGGYSRVGTCWQDVEKESRLLLTYKQGRPLEGDDQCHHWDENKLNDSWDNLILKSLAEHARLHISMNNPMEDEDVRRRHRRVMESSEYRNKQSEIMKGILKDNLELLESRRAQLRGVCKKGAKSLYSNPCSYFRFLLGRQRMFGWTDHEVEKRFHKKFPDSEMPSNNHKIISIERLGVRKVYDMEVEGFHNFATNGVFVHNSQEDERGEQLIGDAGQLLRQHLRKFDVDLDRDCWKTNAVICRPRGNATPTNAQVDACRPNVLRAVEEFRPRTIILLGATAVRSLIGHHWKEDTGPIGKWVGWTIPHRELNAWICPTWHPSYLKRTENRKGEGELLSMFFDRHLEKACSFRKRPWKKRPTRDIRLIFSPEEAAWDIKEQMKFNPSMISFDFETNMLKPDREEAEIVSCSVCWGGRETTAFPWHGPAIDAMIEVFRGPVPKVSHNAKFEDRWVRRALKIKVRNWIWDTMPASHVLDNRTGITGLKFQAFVRLGQDNYNDTVAPFLKAKGGSPVNRIREAPLRDLLHYNALDSALTWELARVQMRDLGFPVPGEE